MEEIKCSLELEEVDHENDKMFMENQQNLCINFKKHSVLAEIKMKYNLL